MWAYVSIQQPSVSADIFSNASLGKLEVESALKTGRLNGHARNYSLLL